LNKLPSHYFWLAVPLALILSATIGLAVVFGLRGQVQINWPQSQRDWTSKLAIDGIELPLTGDEQLRYRVGPGSHQLAASRHGFHAIDQPFSVSPNHSVKIDLAWLPTEANQQTLDLESLAAKATAAISKLPIGQEYQDVRNDLTSLYFDALTPEVQEATTNYLKLLPSPLDRHPALSPELPYEMEGLAWTNGDGNLRHSSTVSGLVILPESKKVLSSGWDGQVMTWSLASGKQAADAWPHSAPLQALAVSADERWLATGGDDGILRVWDLKTRHLRWSDRQRGAILSLDFSANSELLAVGSADNRVRIWKLNLKMFSDTEGDLLGQIAKAGDEASSNEQADCMSLLAQAVMGHRTSSVVFCKNDSRLAIGDLYGNVKLWDRANNSFIERTGGPPIRTFYYDQAADTLVAIGFNLQECRWKLSDDLPGEKTATGVVLAADRDGQWRIHWDDRKKLLELRRQDTNPSRTYELSDGEPTAATFDAKLQALVIGTNSGKILLFDVAKESPIPTWQPSDEALQCADLSIDQSAIVTGNNLGDIAIWDSFLRRETFRKRLYDTSVEKVLFCDKKRCFIATDDLHVVVETLGPQPTTVRWTGKRPLAAGATHDLVVYCREHAIVVKKLSESAEKECVIDSPTAIAVHPTKPIAIIGDRRGQLFIVEHGSEPTPFGKVNDAIEDILFNENDDFLVTTEAGHLYRANRTQPSSVQEVDWRIADWKPKSIAMIAGEAVVSRGGRWAKINDDFSIAELKPVASQSANLQWPTTPHFSPYLFMLDGRGRFLVFNAEAQIGF
jgi:WD40 repeat protein